MKIGISIFGGISIEKVAKHLAGSGYKGTLMLEIAKKCNTQW